MLLDATCWGTINQILLGVWTCLQVEVSEFIYIGLFKIQITSYLKPTNHKTNTPPPQKTQQNPPTKITKQPGFQR